MGLWRNLYELPREAYSRTVEYFKQNYDLPKIKRSIDTALYKPVPRHVNWTYSFGMLALVLFIFGLSASATVPANDAAITGHQLVAEPWAQLLSLVGRS